MLFHLLSSTPRRRVISDFNACSRDKLDNGITPQHKFSAESVTYPPPPDDTNEITDEMTVERDGDKILSLSKCVF